MLRLSVKPGDRLTVDAGAELQIERIGCNCIYLTTDEPHSIFVEHGETRTSDMDIHADLKEKTTEILSLFADIDADSSQEMLSRLVSDLFYAVAQKRQKEERDRKQAEGIARAKAKGIHFGPAARPLPDGFEGYAQMWRQGDISSRDAAKSLGMSHNTFLRYVKKRAAVG